MKKSVIALALLISSAQVPAFAAGEKGDIELGPYVGYGYLDDYNGIEPKNNLLYGARFGYWLTDSVSIEPTYQIIFTEAQGVGLTDDIRNSSVRFNLLYAMLAGKPVRPFFTGGIGWEQFKTDTLGTSNDTGLNVGAGLFWMINDWFGLRLDGRFIYLELGDFGDTRAFNYEGALGLSFFIGTASKDADGDGVKDKNDSCPNTPAGAKVDEKGCPTDADGDGVFDGIDKCEGTPNGATVDATGCTTDTDGDGVVDGIDQCPNSAQGAVVNEKGCVKDADGDGVEDDSDKCPETPKEAKVDAQGCPIDTDGDKVGDYLDQCPDTEAGKKVDTKGCPLVTKSRGVLKGVTFKFNSAELQPNAKTVLTLVAKDLAEFPNVKVEVQGHTDNTGPVAANTKISQGRANSVMDYLVSQGIPRERLQAKGYGPSKPIGSNKTSKGRAQNRRVELVWLD